MKLTQIQNDEEVIIDANVLVYANQQKSEQCKRLVRRCATREVKGIVPMPMVAELVHTLMIIEARENDWIERANPARALSERPEIVRRLTRYHIQMREFLGIGLRIEPATRADIVEMLSIQREFGLLTNDALLLAVARRLNCRSIASGDKAFDRAVGFLIYSPDDLSYL
jgi:predicted nucleic acid-binding protein